MISPAAPFKLGIGIGALYSTFIAFSEITAGLLVEYSFAIVLTFLPLLPLLVLYLIRTEDKGISNLRTYVGVWKEKKSKMKDDLG